MSSLFSFKNKNIPFILKIIFPIIFSLYSIYPHSLAYAEGGPVEKGAPYLVGERGPEVTVPEEEGMVIPSWMRFHFDGYDPLKAVISKIPEANEQKIIEDFRKVTIHPMADKYKLRLPEEK